MPNNLVVDVSSINGTISRVRQMYNEAVAKKYWVRQRGAAGAYSSALHLTSSMKDFKIDANAMTVNGKTDTTWDGWQTPTLHKKYNFRINFTRPPVVTATFEGRKNGVTIRTEVTENYIDVYVTKPGRGSWAEVGAGFTIHLIAVGY